MASSLYLPPVGNEGLAWGAAKEGDIPIETSLPRGKNMGLSGWLSTVRSNPLLNLRTTPSLPKEADVVIIGSGISGAVTALSLLNGPNPPRSVVMLEAREFCSGATGRNAGHCKPDVWRGYRKYKAVFGHEQAMKILQNEKDNFAGVAKYVQDNNVDCEYWKGTTLDVCMTPEIAATAAESFEIYKRAGGDTTIVKVITSPREAEKVSRLKGAQAVYEWEASTLHPWKLVAHIAQQCLDLGLNLQTWTPAESVTGRAGAWRVNTSRGAITTPIVVHATNAYAGMLLPEANGPIRPVPHVVIPATPPSSFAGSDALQHSYAVIYPNAFYTINPSLQGDGHVLFGGTNRAYTELLNFVEEDPARRTDDTYGSVNNFPKIVESARQLGTENFEWDHPKQGSIPKYGEAWSGIIARSQDMVPFVGQVPGKPGQWASVGHNGHGMARIFAISTALAKLIQGASWQEGGLPEVFQITEKRLTKLSGKRQSGPPGWPESYNRQAKL